MAAESEPGHGSETEQGLVRPRVAQALLVVVAAAMLVLPWASGSAVPDLFDVSGDSANGVLVSEGLLVVVIALVAVVFIQIKWRPAWIGAGLATAVTGRAALDLGGQADVSPGLGLWLALACALLATGLLIAEVLAGIRALSSGDGRS